MEEDFSKKVITDHESEFLFMEKEEDPELERLYFEFLDKFFQDIFNS